MTPIHLHEPQTEDRGFLHEQFETMEQQEMAAIQGMWLFLATEVLFFGGMFFAYTVYRRTYPEAFALLSQHLNWILGTVNTAALLTSSLTMALAVQAAQREEKKLLIRYLLLTMLFGFAFLVVKGFEYAEDFSKGLYLGPHFAIPGPLSGQMQILLFLYYVMTAIHGLHLLIGIGVVGLMTLKARKGLFTRTYYTPIEITGLYWHFVDIIWIFLYPLLYLIGRPQ